MAATLKRSIIQTFLTQAPTLLLYFVSSTLMTRILGNDGRGGYALIQNQVMLLTLVLGLDLSFGITFFTSKNKGDPSKMIRIAASLVALNVIVVPIFLFFTFTSRSLSDVLMPGIPLQWGYMGYIYISVIGSQITGFISAIMLGMKQFRVVNIMSIVNAVLSAVSFAILFLFSNKLSPSVVLPVVLAVSLGYGMIMLTLWCFVYIKRVGIIPIPELSWVELRPVLAFVSVGYISGFVNMINYRFDVWVVGNYTDTAQLGLYVVAVGLAQLFFYIPEPFARVVQPYLYGGLTPELLAKYKAISRLNFTSVSAAAIVLALFAPMIVPLLFGEVFSQSVQALWWLLPGVICASGWKLLSPLVVQGGFIRFNLYATSLAALVTITLDFLLVPAWGIIGAAIASTLSYFVLLLIPCLVIRMKMKIPVNDLFLLVPKDLELLKPLLRRQRV